MDSIIPEISTIFDLWRLHPRGDYFLARGGDRIPPPRLMELTLTNKCNLRCEICGSQKSLDKSKTPRSHMEFSTFQHVAETLFPFVAQVELNSRGDPLLYPQIEEVLDTLAQHKCAYYIQHNGTLLTDSIVERLADSYGIISISMDAVGPLFNEVRRNGVWENAEPGLKKLAAARNPKRMHMRFYPTVTKRTANHLFDIVEWAHRHRINAVTFHDYNIINDSTEEKPNQDDKERQFEKIVTFLDKENSSLQVFDDSRTIYNHPNTNTYREMPSPIKAKYDVASYNYPLDADHRSAHPRALCPVPWQSLGVNIEGQINVCCRTQTTPFGGATSVESFADVWFGDNYEKLRKSLARDADGYMPLPACAPCIQQYAPKAGEKVQAIPYKNNVAEDPRGFTYDRPEANLTAFLRENPLFPGYRASLPFGLDPTQYILFEDDQPLGPVSSYEDAIIKGEGRYSFGVSRVSFGPSDSGNTICFSSSDNSDPLRNDRTYILRRKAQDAVKTAAN